MRTEEKMSYYLTKAKTIENNFEKDIRIAVLSSFTLNGMEKVFEVKCADKKIKCVSYLGGYNQYNQEILDETSRLYEFNPDVTFLILDTQSILGDLWYSPYSVDANERKDFVEKKMLEIKNLIQSFTQKSKSKTPHVKSKSSQVSTLHKNTK